MRAALDGLEKEIGASIAGRKLSNLRFADDIWLIAEKLEQAQLLLDQIDKESTRYGQQKIAEKTEWMKTTRVIETKKAKTSEVVNKVTNQEQIVLTEHLLKQVKTFKYLGATISANGESIQDIRIKTATALRVVNDLLKTWNDKGVSIQTKIRLYRALIQPIALYGCEYWTLRKAEETFWKFFFVSDRILVIDKVTLPLTESSYFV